MIRDFMSREFLIFLLTGGSAAAVNFGSRIVYNQWLSFSNAVIVAYITGMITAFVLARVFVFRHSTQALHVSALRFVAINLLAVLQTWGVSMLMAYQILPAFGISRWVPELAHAVGVMIPVFTSYLGHKYWSFGGTQSK